MNSKMCLLAHRGLHSNTVPENSIEAFKEAIKAGYNIELDVCLTKDNKLIVFHDYNLKRLTGLDKNINECTLEYIKTLKLNNTMFSIPTLEEVLNLVNGSVLIYIEIKSKYNTTSICKNLNNILKNYTGNFLIASFNPLDLLWFKHNQKKYERVQLAMKSYSFKSKYLKYILSNTLLNFLTKPSYVSYKYNEIDNKLIQKYKNKKTKILLWTIKSKEQFDKFTAEADGTIFENFLI
ncbi:MAG: glycerophosphodiester phosphodiesterase family protein [Clostridia bacterium]